MNYNNDSMLLAKSLADLECFPLVVTSKELKIISCNDEALKIFSLNTEFSVGKDVAEIFDGLESYLDFIQAAIQAKEPKKISNVLVLSKIPDRFDILFIPLDNETYFFIRGKSQQDAAHGINKKEMLGNLIANICNSFNNILGAINGNSSILRNSTEVLSDPSVKEEFTGYLDLIDKSVARAADLIVQLNSFSSKINVEYREVDLNDVIRSVYIDYLSKLGPEIIIDAEILSTKSMVKIDPSLMQTSLRYICENAVHAMTIMKGTESSHSGGNLTITIDHVETDKAYRVLHPKAIKSTYWCITISDDGVGIKKELIKKVCSPFFTEGKSSLNPDGLGLSEAINIVQEHGGFLEIESEVKKGTDVRIFIPEYKPYEQKKEKLAPDSLVKSGHSAVMQGMSSALKAAGEPYLVLVVDDDIIMRRVAEVVLEKAGYKVIVASDGDEAVDIYKEKHNSIVGVFLDNCMPNMTGINAFYEMKKINPDVKALLVSGLDGDSEEVRMAIKNGMHGFIKKPYTMMDLNKKAKELLDSN